MFDKIKISKFLRRFKYILVIVLGLALLTVIGENSMLQRYKYNQQISELQEEIEKQEQQSRHTCKTITPTATSHTPRKRTKSSEPNIRWVWVTASNWSLTATECLQTLMTKTSKLKIKKGQGIISCPFSWSIVKGKWCDLNVTYCWKTKSQPHWKSMSWQLFKWSRWDWLHLSL